MTPLRVDQLDIPPESMFVSTARNFVARVATASGWLNEVQLDDLKLVVSESVTNAFRAHARRSARSLIRVRAELFDDRLEFSVTDAGGGFESPAGKIAVPEPSPDREGGFGLPLMSALSDEVHFARTDDGTTVRVVVYRDEPPARAESSGAA